MNEVRVQRLVLAGLATLVIFVAMQILLEGISGRAVCGHGLEDQWLQKYGPREWTAANYLVALLLAVFQSTLVMWLYASLRPMYGVGTKTALITCAFGIAWMASNFITVTNLGLFPARLAFLEAASEVIEFPLAMIVGAAVYEGKEKETRATEEL